MVGGREEGSGAVAGLGAAAARLPADGDAAVRLSRRGGGDEISPRRLRREGVIERG